MSDATKPEISAESTTPAVAMKKLASKAAEEPQTSNEETTTTVTKAPKKTN